MLNPDFKTHHPAWKLAALIVDRSPSIIRSGALLLAAYHAPGGMRWLAVLLAKGYS